ncbi:MAG: riboflavin synthase [Planctomycetes bacterium]|nr:riboflavin synthase [Planctomycetota bacterium]
MFTGLVERIGTISGFESISAGKRLVLRCKPWDLPLVAGESISVNGCCLTVVSHALDGEELVLSFDVIPESLSMTTLGEATLADAVNIERALRADGLLGGHQVQGHIDAIEDVIEVSEEGDKETRVRCSMRNVDKDTVVPKGSITIDGVSLTIAAVDSDTFEVALVPTTLRETTLGSTKVGDQVNIETDIIARTVVRVVRNMSK